MPWQMHEQCIILKSQVKWNELNSTPKGLKTPFKILIIFFTARNFIDFSKNRKSNSFIDTANKRTIRINIMVNSSDDLQNLWEVSEKERPLGRNVICGSQHWYISIKLKKKNNNKHQKCDDLTTPLQRTNTYPLYIHYYVYVWEKGWKPLSHKLNEYEWCFAVVGVLPA